MLRWNGRFVAGVRHPTGKLSRRRLLFVPAPARMDTYSSVPGAGVLLDFVRSRLVQLDLDHSIIQALFRWGVEKGPSSDRDRLGLCVVGGMDRGENVNSVRNEMKPA